jgi:hypothetical protein
MYSSSGFAIRRIPICRYNDSWPYNGCFSLCRDSELHNFEVYGLLVHGIPDFPMDDFPFGTFPECSNCHHASSHDGWILLLPGFSLGKFPTSCHRDSRFHKCQYPDGHASRRDLQPPIHKGLTLMHLLTDPTTIGSF